MGAIDLEQACRRYGASVLRRCVALIADRDEAEDVAQEVFVMLMRKGDQIRDPAAISSWVYRLTTHQCLNHLRSKGRRQNRETCEVVASWQDRPNTTPFADYSAQQLLDCIAARLDELGQHIFIYRFLDGMTQEEIACLTGKSRRTVGKRLAKIEAVLAELREQMETAT